MIKMILMNTLMHTQTLTRREGEKSNNNKELFLISQMRPFFFKGKLNNIMILI